MSVTHKTTKATRAAMGDENDMTYKNTKLEKVLIDSNLVVDFLLNRDVCFNTDTNHIFHLLDRKEIRGFITDLGLAVISFYAQARGGKTLAEDVNLKIRSLFEVCKIEKEVMDNVKKSKLTSVDNAVYLECSLFYNFDVIITSNIEEIDCSYIKECKKELRVFTVDQYVRDYYQHDIKLMLDEDCSEYENEPVYSNGSITYESHSSAGKMVQSVKPTISPTTSKTNFFSQFISGIRNILHNFNLSKERQEGGF